MNSSDIIKVVSSSDPAVDLKASDLQQYFLTRDAKHLVFRNGMEPAWFFLRRPPKSMVTKYIDSAPVRWGEEPRAKWIRAFEVCVVKVENLQSDAEGGATFAEWEPGWVQQKGAAPAGALTNEELEHFHPDDILEIGHLAYDRCFLRRGSRASYAVPPMWQESSERALRLPAEEILAALNQASDDSPQQSAPTDGGDGDKPTDATAKGSEPKQGE